MGVVADGRSGVNDQDLRRRGCIRCRMMEVTDYSGERFLTWGECRGRVSLVERVVIAFDSGLDDEIPTRLIPWWRRSIRGFFECGF